MIVALVALIVWNIAAQILAARREARLVDAIMARNGAEYAHIRRSGKTVPKPAPQPDPEAATGWQVGLS
jgi:hypothetical protein